MRGKSTADRLHVSVNEAAFTASESGHDAAVSRVIAELGRLASSEQRSTSEMEELVSENRRKDELLATVCHELRGPLASVRHAGRLLRSSAQEGSLIEKVRALIERQVQYMSRIVDDLLDVSRISSGQMQLKLERIDLRVVVNNAIQTLRPQIEASHHQLTSSSPEEPVWLMADSQRLEQVFVNLLDNAVKYTASPGQLAVWVHAGDTQAIVRIRDTGRGIAPQLLPHVFDLYRQGDAPDSNASSGLGIGLAVVRNVVRLHGGSVTATSRGSGQGSEFSVRLLRAV